MRNIFLSTLLILGISSVSLLADNVKGALNETGIYLNGKCKAIASSPDGYIYVLTRDNKLIRIDCDGEKKEIVVPMNKEIKSEDDYFCDMAVDTKTAYFCACNYSSIQALDLNNPKELKAMKLSYNNNNISPMMISRTSDGWSLKDFDQRTFKIDKKGSLTLLPDFSEIELDKNGKAVIIDQPQVNPDGTTIYSNKVFNENKSIKWVAPTPEEPQKVTSIEYLGNNSDSKLDIYLVNVASGELDSELTIYAVDSNNKIIYQKQLPNPNYDFIMRYCKLASDGSIIAVYADLNDPDGKFILKRFVLNSNEVSNKEKG